MLYTSGPVFVVIYRVCLSPRNQHCFPVAICLSSDRYDSSPLECTTPLPVLKELVLSLKMGYWILTNTGMGPYIQQQGLCTAFTVASLGDLGGFSPCIGRALGEIRARKPLIHGTGKCVRALRWQYPYFGLRLRVIDMDLATKYLIMVI